MSGFSQAKFAMNYGNLVQGLKRKCLLLSYLYYYYVFTFPKSPYLPPKY